MAKRPTVTFPKTVYASRARPSDGDTWLCLSERLDDVDGSEDGSDVEVGVYELREVKRLRITRELV